MSYRASISLPSIYEITFRVKGLGGRAQLEVLRRDLPQCALQLLSGEGDALRLARKDPFQPLDASVDTF